MNIENEDQIAVDQPAQTTHESQTRVKISYTREFLLSLSGLDVCKQLPGGFDQSVLSEFDDSFQERPRISGGLSSHSFRRNEYGSSPPTRGDSSSFSRGGHGRWESRSSVRSDKDSDSQSDWEADSVRRYNNQARRSWQVPEHDGLLGSGSFPRPSGFVAGASAPKLRANDQFQLSKSNEPYHPPRPYKVPHSRRETHDSYNDETFGSLEYTSEDRAEEENKRRASFELMRKEQQKEFLEKRKLNPEKRKDEFDLLVDSKVEISLLNRSNESDDPVILKASNDDSEKTSFPSQSPATRPLVPPGFTSTVLEKNFGPKSGSHMCTAEVVNPAIENSIAHSKGNLVLNRSSHNQLEQQSTEQKGFSVRQLESTNDIIPTNEMCDSNLDAQSSNTIDVVSQLHKTSHLSEAFEASENSKVIELNGENVARNRIVGESNRDHSTSLLDKIFGSALTSSGGGSFNFIEKQESKADETWSPNAAQSSKFAHWFLEEEKKTVDDLSSSRPNDLLSLIVGGEKGGFQAPDVKNTEHVLPNFPLERSEPAEGQMTSNANSAVVENSEELYKNSKPQAVTAVITCEDLEQSILLEISGNGSTLQQADQVLNIPDPKTEQPIANIDDHASQHLLSLLQKGTTPKDIAQPPGLDIRSSEKLHISEDASLDSPVQTKEVNAENSSNSGQTLTLETLFGTAFMKELQSVGAPVSVQRGSVGSARVNVSEPHEFPFPVMDEDLVLANEIGSSAASYETGILTSKQRLQTKPVNIEEQWIGFEGPQTELNPSQHRTGLKSKPGGFDGPVDIRLPEEDSLIMVNDPLNLQKYATAKTTARTELLPSQNTQVDIAAKLAALNSIFKDERAFTEAQESPHFLRGPYDLREPDIPFQNLSLQPSSPQIHTLRSNHRGPSFHPLDSHPANNNPQIKFMTPEGIIQHDPLPNHKFPTNMVRPTFHHPSTGLSGAGYDPPRHHPLLQQMHMSGNFPPPHLLQGFPRSAPMPAQPTQPNRGAPLPPNVNNHMTGFMSEPNPLQAFPFSNRPPNFAGLGMPPTAPEVGGGSNHPEAIQRFLELELRSKSKQIQPFATSGHGQGTYGHELDMGFGYR